ncbi:unnamed protein product [Coccothraustes coccothraustes]
MQALRKGEDAYLELSGAKGQSRTIFSRSRALESTGTGTMLSGRRSRFFASGSRRARPLLRREDRSRTILNEPRSGEHCYRHNAQCVKKPRLRFHQPESAAAAET